MFVSLSENGPLVNLSLVESIQCRCVMVSGVPNNFRLVFYMTGPGEPKYHHPTEFSSVEEAMKEARRLSYAYSPVVAALDSICGALGNLQVSIWSQK